MGKSYSEDLRLKVMTALEGGMSKMVAHKTFGISRSTIDDWLRQREEVGHVRPLAPVRCGPLGAIADLPGFAAFARRHNSATLEQMSHAWEQETGRKLSRNTFSLALKKIGWTRKKRVVSTASATKTNAPASASN
jgi:transposase